MAGPVVEEAESRAGLSSAPEAGGARRAVRVPRRDLALLAYAFGLLVFWSPALNAGLVTPRAAVLLAGLGPGLLAIVRKGDRSAWLALGYVGWAALAALASSQPRIALVGSYGSDLGWIYLAGALSAWGLGRQLGTSSRRSLILVILAGIGLNGAVATAQAVLDPGGLLRMVDGRASGLTPNSLFLGGLLAGALAMVGALVGRAGERWPIGVLAVACLAFSCNLTGSRAALAGGSALAVVGALGWPASTRRAQVGTAAAARSAAVGLAIVVGVVASLAIQSGTSASARAGSSSSGGVTTRAEMWSAGIDAAVERPVLGWGPGRFRAATSARTTAEFVRAEGVDRIFYDAHNLLVEQLTTTGVVGLLLLLLFAWEAARRARGPLAWFTAGVAFTWLFSPTSISTAPLAQLALGAAWSREPGPRLLGGGRVTRSLGHGPQLRFLAALLALAGAIAGGVLVVADAHVNVGAQERDPRAIQRAERLLPPDAVLADLESAGWRASASEGGGRADLLRSLAAAERAVELDPTRSTWWVHLAYAQAGSGVGSEASRLAQAEGSLRAALERSPWSAEAMTGLLRIAELRGDDEKARRWADRLCEVGVCGNP